MRKIHLHPCSAPHYHGPFRFGSMADAIRCTRCGESMNGHQLKSAFRSALVDVSRKFGMTTIVPGYSGFESKAPDAT